MVKLDRPPALVKAANHDWDCEIQKAMPVINACYLQIAEAAQ